MEPLKHLPAGRQAEEMHEIMKKVGKGWVVSVFHCIFHDLSGYKGGNNNEFFR